MMGVLSVFSEYSEINAAIYLSGYAPASDTAKLKSYGITLVVDATNIPQAPTRIASLKEMGIDYMNVPVDDIEEAPISTYFDAVCAKLMEVKNAGRKALVHCAAGISRSATLVIVYLVKHEAMTLRDAYELVRARRPVICPNNGFWHQMIAFERALRGAASVLMRRTRFRGELPDCYALVRAADRRH